MKRLSSRVGLLLLLALLLPAGGCATIAGTAASPVTGGVDLVKQGLRPTQWPLAPFVFLGGVIAGPFVAMYNGVNHDASVFHDFGEYWDEFPEVFRPFEMVGVD